MIQAHVFISGFVQNIGFRQYVRSKANVLGLTGFVSNLPDGRVEAVLQGRKELINKMILLCRDGPFLSNVENIDTNWEKAIDKFEDFVIL